MKKTFGILLILLLTQFTLADVIISKVDGDVRVRRGLDENWTKAANGMTLKVIDTILTLEGNADLEMNDGTIFHLGSNSILDIGDLRRITKREMFLYLMSSKVDKIAPREDKAKLRVGNVSVVHGEMKSTTNNTDLQENTQSLNQEFNGALALYNQQFYTNTVVKLKKIQGKSQTTIDCGKIDYYLALTFEELNEPGQAIDAYQAALEQCQACENTDTQLLNQIESALKRLKI